MNMMNNDRCCCLSSSCHIAASDMAPGLVSVNEVGGMGNLLTWAGHDLATLSIIIAFWQSLNGGGGWVVSLMVVVGRKKQRCGNV